MMSYKLKQLERNVKSLLQIMSYFTILIITTSSSIAEELETWTNNDNWIRNQKLVDFNQMPDWVEEKVLEVWNEPIEGKRSLLFNYFVQNKLKMLMEDIQEF